MKFLTDQFPSFFWIVFHFSVNLEDSNQLNLNKSAQYLQFHTFLGDVFAHFNSLGFKFRLLICT